MDNGELIITDQEPAAEDLCECCGGFMLVAAGFESTPLCHECAHAEVDRLRGFVQALFEKSGWPEAGDIDAGDFQELAVAHGLLKPETRTAPCHQDCFCAEYHGDMAAGVTCYRKVEWLKAAPEIKKGPRHWLEWARAFQDLYKTFASGPLRGSGRNRVSR